MLPNDAQTPPPLLKRLKVERMAEPSDNFYRRAADSRHGPLTVVYQHRAAFNRAAIPVILVFLRPLPTRFWESFFSDGRSRI
jgi:hypothetical protein